MDVAQETTVEATAAPTTIEGSLVANGKHVVPPGVAVEELKKYDGQNKLRDECPPDVEGLLRKQNCFDVYDRFVKAVVETSNTRNWLGKWKDQEFVHVLDLFSEDFAEHGIKVVYCKRSSSGGSYRWLEYIDIGQVPDYVAQYDVSNLSGQTIKTCYTTLNFPQGVAVEEIKQYGSKKREKLKEKCPPYVEKMMADHDLTEEYQGMVDDMARAGVGKPFKDWNLKKLHEISEAWGYKFEAKGVKIYVSHKEEYVSHGQVSH
jgi:hypothetical protein